MNISVYQTIQSTHNFLFKGNRVAVSLQNNGLTYIYSSDHNLWYRSWNWDHTFEEVYGIAAVVSSDNRLFLAGGQRGNNPNDYKTEIYEFHPTNGKKKVGDLETARKSMGPIVVF